MMKQSKYYKFWNKEYFMEYSGKCKIYHGGVKFNRGGKWGLNFLFVAMVEVTSEFVPHGGNTFRVGPKHHGGNGENHFRYGPQPHGGNHFRDAPKPNGGNVGNHF